MKTELYWIGTSTPGRLAVMPRPRGGDWLEDEVRAWRQSGIDVIVSLLTDDEIAHFELAEETALSRSQKIEFVPFPITDRGVPNSGDAFDELVGRICEHIIAGRNVAIHCRQGIGRAAMVAMSALVRLGIDPEVAIRQVETARGCPVPETPELRRYILDFARRMTLPLPR